MTAKATARARIQRGGGDGHDQGNDHTCYQISLIDLMSADLCGGELYAQTYDVGYQVERKYLEDAEPDLLPEAHIDSGCDAVLVSDIVDTEEEGGDQGDHHDDHDSLEVVAVPYVRAALGDGIGHSEE